MTTTNAKVRRNDKRLLALEVRVEQQGIKLKALQLALRKTRHQLKHISPTVGGLLVIPGSKMLKDRLAPGAQSRIKRTKVILLFLCVRVNLQPPTFTTFTHHLHHTHPGSIQFTQTKTSSVVVVGVDCVCHCLDCGCCVCYLRGCRPYSCSSCYCCALWLRL